MALVSITQGNKKLNGQIATFSLPPVKSCPNAGACKKYCYAKKAFRLYKTTEKAWTKNMEVTKKPYFTDLMIDQIKELKDITTFRIHVSGDFYNQKYFDSWCEIAENVPHIMFYSYTKSWHLNIRERPSNLKVIVSMGGKKDITPKEIKKRGFDGYTYVTE